MKKILFGIALILLGIFCIIALSLGNGGFFMYMSIVFPVLGFIFCLLGLVSKEE